MIEIREVLKGDPVRNEVAAIVGEGRTLPKGEEWNVTPEMVERALVAEPPTEGERTTRPFTEAVIREFARPVLLIRNNRIELPRSREIRTGCSRRVPASRLVCPQSVESSLWGTRGCVGAARAG